MKLDWKNASDVDGLFFDLRGRGLVLVIVDAEVSDVTTRGHASLWAAADTIVDCRDGKAIYLKRRDA